MMFSAPSPDATISVSSDTASTDNVGPAPTKASRTPGAKIQATDRRDASVGTSWRWWSRLYGAMSYLVGRFVGQRAPTNS